MHKKTFKEAKAKWVLNSIRVYKHFFAVADIATQGQVLGQLL